MLELKPCFGAADLAPYCKQCGKVPSSALYLYRATDRGAVLGACLFEVDPEGVSAVHYEGDGDDPFLFDALLRAGLNYASGQGISTGRLPERFRIANERHFAQLNYPPQLSFDITNFFSKYKRCVPTAD